MYGGRKLLFTTIFTTSVNFALAKITNDFVFLSPIIILVSFKKFGYQLPLLVS